MMNREKREQLGKMVRDVWISWASEQKDPKLSWLVSWEVLSEPDKEVDRRIGEALYNYGWEEGQEADSLFLSEISRSIFAQKIK